VAKKKSGKKSEEKTEKKIEKKKRKKWKIFLVAFVAVLVLAVGGLYTFQLIVDPFGVWGGPEIAGFNNFKSVQDKNERMWKIYEYYHLEPDVAFFGSSRINYCTPAEWPGVDDDKVFNFGLNAAHIPEESYYFKGALEAHQPEIAAVGLDMLQFSAIYNEPHAGYSEERLQMVAGSPLTAFFYKSRETVLSFDAIERSFDVMEASEEKPDDVYHVRGWDTQRLKRKWSTPRWKFRQQLFRYHTRTYRRYRPAPENFEMFGEMMKKAKELGVKVVLYIHPVHADFLVSYDVNGKWRLNEQFKRQIVKHGPVWDFNYVNDISRDRDNYQDPSHFKADVARKFIEVMAQDEPIKGLDFGVKLTEKNIDEVLKQQRQALDDYIDKNQGIRELLEEARRTKDRRAYDRASARLIGR
jgi:hypothetical protein